MPTQPTIKKVAKRRLSRTGQTKDTAGVGAASAGARERQGWLSTRARTDLASVTVYALHVLQERIQKVIRRRNQGHEVSADNLQSIREAVLALWRDAKRHTRNGVPLRYEDHVELEKKGARPSRT